MKALVYHGPGSKAWEEVPEPRIQADTDAIVRVDAVTICVSIQYLQKPVAVLREVARVLRPGGVVAVTFSNRCFPTKAVAIWRMLEARSSAACLPSTSSAPAS